MHFFTYRKAKGSSVNPYKHLKLLGAAPQCNVLRINCIFIYLLRTLQALLLEKHPVLLLYPAVVKILRQQPI